MINKNEPVIEVKGLSKRYVIDHEQKAQYGSLRDSVSAFVKKPFEKKGQELGHDSHEEFWALKDVSFTVNKGEIFGVIGRNGSGKSTLLKTLSRIINPTTGTALIHGRTASLLEVGTGFHPELTGRENIFFNGSMLGMSRDEIGKKFDEIVKFAEIEKFLDTPVKFYSSGMYVRLAFSVAAHLEPDVLILDEVLAVGDERFQQKSMKKILSTMESGTTVLFVSHSMGSVQKLCSRGLLLRDGKIDFIGDVEELTHRYLSMMSEDAPEEALKTSWSNDGAVDNDQFVPQKLYVVDENKKQVDGPVANNKDHYVVIEANIKEASDLLTVGYAIYNANGTLQYFSCPTDAPQSQWPVYKNGPVKMYGKIPKHLLNAGKYRISVIGGVYNKFWIFDPEQYGPSIDYEISGGLSESPYWKNPRSGNLAPEIKWEIE